MTGLQRWKAARLGRLARFRRARGGAAATEFALVLPIFMLCLFGTIAFASALLDRKSVV